MKITRMNRVARKLLSESNPEIIYYHRFPKFECLHSRPKSGLDQVRKHEITINILLGWGGITIEI